ncbi:MAG: energy-coupling factor transporter ATPase [Clostridiaceae bacterium]|nr:energy-coupling factor transporter ATPase [Clostridiaceae bacterium]
MPKPVISAENITFSYPASEGEATHPALENITIQIEKSEFVAILGHNGSGKSTFAKHLNAILLPSGGCVYIDGMDTKDESLLLAIREKCGMVFQNPDNQIVATMVEEDVAFAPENMGVPPAEIRKRVDDCLEIVGMSAFKRHAPHLLSGGQKQRVAIAGVLAMEPSILVMDEPTAMLDPSGRREVMNTVLRLNRERGITVVLITHHMDEAALAGRVIVMSDGKVAMSGTPKEVFSKVEEIKKLSLLPPQTIDLLYRLDKTGYDLPLDALSVKECADVLQNFLKCPGINQQ